MWPEKKPTEPCDCSKFKSLTLYEGYTGDLEIKLAGVIDDVFNQNPDTASMRDCLKTIDQIKQAFKDEGWVEPRDICACNFSPCRHEKASGIDV